MDATLLVLARHGETDWNREHRLQGWADPPLNDRGRAQASRLAESLVDAGIELVVTSDLRRAAETAAAVAERLGLDVIADAGLREVDLGSWSGKLRSEVEGLVRPDGETREELRDRVLAAIRRVAAARPGTTLLVVSHGGSLGTVHEAATGERPPAIWNCATFRVAVDVHGIRLVAPLPQGAPADPEADDAEAAATR